MAVWIAKFIGPIIFCASIPMVFTPLAVQELTKKFLQDSPLIFISGILAMVAGLSILNNFHLWSWHWSVIITLFGWALLLGGATRVIAPSFVNKVGVRFLEKPLMTRIAGMVWGLLALFLCYKAYF